jgi:broad specificity phosphatase PhoE
VSRLWLARHAEAVPDQSKLSDAGRRQAALLGARLAGAGITRISHGPLPRAVETAQIVAEHLPGVPVEVAAELDDEVPPAGADAMVARFADPPADELLITHAFQVAWFVREALGAPRERWEFLYSGNTGVTVIRYAAGRPPVPMVFNDMTHLPPELRWTGFSGPFRL